MNDRLVLPLYFTPNRRWSKINLCDLKWLILFLLLLSTLAIYVLFINLPTDIKTVNIQNIFIPDIHDHEKGHQQNPEPPIASLNNNKPVENIKQITTTTTTTIKAIEIQKPTLDEENKIRREKVKEVFENFFRLFFFNLN